MSSPPPTKPPRGVKQGRETSGLLMSVIRTLSASETNEQREKERAKLEKEYKKSDARLDELVAAHAQEIMDVMQKFTQVSQALSTWGLHCEAAVGRVSACRGLLRLRRDDLKRLWADARTHHHALNMLTDIERVVVSEREAREQAAAGLVLAAATTLRTALATADTSLAHVTALHATKAHLQAKRGELVDVIVRRLSDAVYRSERAPLSRRLSSRRRAALLLAELTKSAEVTDEYLQDITPELEASLTEEDMTFETTAIISLEALGVLDQLREATEKFKCQIQNELLEVIDSVSRRIIDEGEIDEEGEEDGEMAEGEGVTETGRPLARLVSILAHEFRACAARNKRLLQLWRAALQKYKYSETWLHTEQHYWSAVQQVMQLLLTEYLEISSVTQAATAARAEPTHNIRIADCFAKKPNRTRPRLFRLTAPANIGGAAPASRRQRYPLVCRPDPTHLYAVLPALHALCADIEPSTGGGECSLRAFISDYVRTGESERLSSEARTQIETATKNADAWRERTAPPQTSEKPGKSGDRHRVVFLCCVTAWAAVKGAAIAAQRCGLCAGHEATRAAHHAIATLATQCLAAQSRLKAGAGRAAKWLADDDIVRFLQTLPNWTLAKRDAQELNQAYEREAEILGSSLGDGILNRSDIIADVNSLVDIAVFCESMDWLSANVKTIPSLISSPNSSGGGVKLSDKFLNDISSAALIFEEMSNKCLLLLHLELRIECFYYLGQEDQPGEGDPEEESGAAKLAARLLAFHEQASTVLARSRMAYILNGLGEMMSSAIVWRWQGSGVVGGTRLAALRHALAALQLPHAGLQRAHRYLRLMTSTEQEIIASIQEKGPQFSELEYLNAFKVIGARRNLSPAEMRAHLKQLSAALGHVGVTV